MIEYFAIFFTTILLFVLLSQYALLIKRKKDYTKIVSPSLSILVPAHNEEKYIEETINAIIKAKYRNKKEIIVIDDGSADNTTEIIKKYSKKGLVKYFRTDHIGKSNALNKATEIAKNEIIVIIDADSVIEKDSLQKLVKPFADEKVGAVSGIIKVRNRKQNFLAVFQNIEYLHSSLFRSLCGRINSNIFTPGPLSAFRKNLLKAVGGFNTRTYMEDVDISLKLVKKGYRVEVSEEAFTSTNVPTSFKSWVKQRVRWTKGGISIIRNNLDFYFNRKYLWSSFYSLPLMSYWYIHSLFMTLFILYQVIFGYYSYFFVFGNFISFDVVRYFVFWFSIFGITNLAYQMLTGTATSLLIKLSVLVTLLTYPLYIYSFVKWKEEIKIKDVLALIFMFPYWFMVLIIQLFSNLEWFKTGQRNIWEK